SQRGKKKKKQQQLQAIANMGASLSCFGSGGCYADEPPYEQLRRPSRKVRPSDEDGEPDVDMKASAFIARFLASTKFVEP
ncbi:hypothetical protein BAE44_0016803, partial [Dichanthelium oligosanthes]